MNRIVGASVIFAMLAVGAIVAALIIPSGGSGGRGTGAAATTAAATTTSPAPRLRTSSDYGGVAPTTGLGPVPDMVNQCDPNVAAGPNTSCPFADNVFIAVAKADRDTQIPAWVTAYSSATNQTYRLNCEINASNYVVCANATGGIVTFPRWAAEVYCQRSQTSTNGDGSGVSASAFVGAVCSAVRTWAQDINGRSGALNVASITDASQGKVAIQNFFAVAVSDTQGVVSQLQSAGVPSVPDGQSMSSALVSSFNRIEVALAQGQSQAAALPTDNAAAFQAAGQSLATSVKTTLSGIGSGVSGLKSPELETAARSDPTCASL